MTPSTYYIVLEPTDEHSEPEIIASPYPLKTEYTLTENVLADLPPNLGLRVDWEATYALLCLNGQNVEQCTYLIVPTEEELRWRYDFDASITRSWADRHRALLAERKATQTIEEENNYNDDSA